MAAELGCSKSSFYWYFNNRNEYISCVVERWSEITTQQVIRNASRSEKAEDQLMMILTQLFSVTQKGDFLFYLRKLAIERPSLHPYLATIEQTRMEYVQGILCKLGLPPMVAEQKATILYHYYLGWYERHKNEQIGEEELLQHIHMLRAQLIGV